MLGPSGEPLAHVSPHSLTRFYAHHLLLAHSRTPHLRPCCPCREQGTLLTHSTYPLHPVQHAIQASRTRDSCFRALRGAWRAWVRYACVSAAAFAPAILAALAFAVAIDAASAHDAAAIALAIDAPSALDAAALAPAILAALAHAAAILAAAALSQHSASRPHHRHRPAGRPL